MGESTERSGFTLIELIAAVTIVSVVLAIGIASYSAFHARQKVRQAALTLKNNLRLAQNYSSSGVLPSVCTAELNRYQVRFTNNPTEGQYDIYFICNASTGTPVTGIVLSEKLPAGTMFIPPLTDLDFDVLNKQLSAPVTISITKGSNTETLTVNINGDISEN